MKFLLSHIKTIFILAIIAGSLAWLNHYINLRINNAINAFESQSNSILEKARAVAIETEKRLAKLDAEETRNNAILEQQNLDGYVDRIRSIDQSKVVPASDFLKSTIRNLKGEN